MVHQACAGAYPKFQMHEGKWNISICTSTWLIYWFIDLFICSMRVEHLSHGLCHKPHMYALRTWFLRGICHVYYMFGKLSLTLIQGIVKLSYSLLSIYSFLATTSADTTVNIWQTADFSLKKTLKEANQRWVWDCAFSEDSQYLITGVICTCLNTWWCYQNERND